MLQNGNMSFFGIEQCGFYTHGGEEPEGFGIEKTFDSIKEWVDSRAFEESIPWDPKSTNKTDCYCHDIHKDPNTGDYLLVLWKSDSKGTDDLYGIQQGAAKGTRPQLIKQKSKSGGKPVIWGRPCYYWVIPEFNCVVSIRFENSRCDAVMFQDWLQGCVNFRIDHPGFRKRTDANGHTRLSFTDDEGVDHKYSYRFDMGLKSLNTSSAELVKLARRVTHIVRRETVVLKTADARASWLKAFGALSVPFASHKDRKKRRNIELIVEARPTAAEIKKIIEKYAKESSGSGWAKVGFKHDSGIAWADKYRLTNFISIDDKGDELFGAEFLLSKLNVNRDAYLKPIQRDSKLGTGS